MRKILIATLFMLTGMTALNAQNKGAVEFIEDKPFAEVLARASQAGRYAFVDVYATWCGPCQYMASRVFTQAVVGDYFNEEFVNAKYDAEKGEGMTIARAYHVRAYPTFLILNDQGEEVGRLLGGSKTPEDFLERVKTELKKVRE